MNSTFIPFPSLGFMPGGIRFSGRLVAEALAGLAEVLEAGLDWGFDDAAAGLAAVALEGMAGSVGRGRAGAGGA